MLLRGFNISIFMFLTCLILVTVFSKSIVRHHDKHLNHRFKPQNIRDYVSDQDIKAAFQHSLVVTDATSCHFPKPRVIHVRKVYPDPSKYYLPHCTILYRCGDDTGCCGSDSLKCVAAYQEEVTLNFYSVRLVEDGLPVEQTIEKLVFTNHTKCGCAPNFSGDNDGSDDYIEENEAL